jgi:hypothetical protein
LLWFLRCRGRWWCFSRLCCRSGGGRATSGFQRVCLIIEPNDILRNIDLRGTIYYRCSLRGGIQHQRIAVLAGIAVYHIHHLRPNIIDNIGLRSAHLFVQVILFTLKFMTQQLTLALQFTLFSSTERSMAITEAVL